MPKCKQCGAHLEPGERYCPTCGAPAVSQEEAFEQHAARFAAEWSHSADYTHQYLPNDIETNRLMTMFCYLGILWIIPCLTARTSPYVRFHLNQGLLLLVTNLLLNGILSVIRGIPLVGAVCSILVMLLQLAYLAFGLYHSYKGHARELPFIGRFRVLH